MKKPCKKCGNENEIEAKTCPNCGIEYPAVTGKVLFKSLLRLMVLILASIGIYSYFSNDEGEYNKYRLLSKDTSLIPEKVSLTFEVGIDGKKPTKSNLMYLAKRVKKEFRSTKRVFVLYYLPGMNSGSGAYASGHSNPSTEVKILGHEPKEWCFGEGVEWRGDLNFCIHEETS